LAPYFHKAILLKRAEIEALQFEDASQQLRQAEVLKSLDEEILLQLNTYMGVMEEDDVRWVLDLAIPVALNIVAWTVISAYLLLFVVPYLILGGWLRGVFYMLILGISFFTENLLSRYAPDWFRLPPNTAGHLLFVAFFVFANAILFDWIFEVATDTSRPCPSCQALLDGNVLFCQHCGLLQK
jgi:hypothetical protein